MHNELLFVGQAIFMGCALLIALRIGKEALIALIACLAIFANLFVVKQITLFGFNATASDAYAVGCMLGLNVLQEYYGNAITKLAVWISFFVAVMFAISSYVHLLYIPFATDTTQAAYVAILLATPRIVAASLFTYFIVQQFDMRLYGFLKHTFENRFYIIRNYSSVALSQLLDTVLFSFLGLYGIVTHVGEIILVSYTIKLAVLFLSTPFLMIARRFNRTGAQT